MNAIANQLFLEGNKFMPKIHLRQSCFTYSACGPFTKNKQQKQREKKGDS